MKTTSKVASFVGALALAAGANAAVTYVSGNLTENFDNLTKGTLTANGNVSPSPFSATAGVQAAITGSTFDGTKLSGTGTTAMPLAVDSGAGTTGAIYNYGTSFAATDRSLGMVASGPNIAGFGIEIKNGTGLIIDSFTIMFTAEQWRESTVTQNILAFAYGISGGTATGSNYLSDTSLIANTGGDVVGSAAVTGSQTIASAPRIQGNISLTITGLSVAPNASIFLRWQDTNDTGNDAGLAIDDFKFSATTIPTPGAISLIGLGGLVALRRKR